MIEHTECDEVADNMKPPRFKSFDEASRWVRSRMPDESMQVIDNVAESLYLRQQ